MNKVIKELAEQAGYYIDPDFDIEFEVFTRLIVRECLDIAGEYDGCGSTIVSRIEKHFGVKE